MRSLFAIAIAVLACSCGPREPYTCTTPEQCVSGGAPGVCEPTGFCSFDDTSCESGRRYESNAGGGLAGTCTPYDMPPPPPEVCGALDQTCCKSGAACVGSTRCDSNGSCAKCVLDVAFGAHAGCVLKYDGTVWCAGDNRLGQLGSGITGPAVPTWTQARDATGVITDAAAIASGKDNTCALRSGGSVWCWGDTIGNAAVQTVKTDDTPLTGIIELGLGLTHRCGRDANGGVWCWGANGGGQLGDGTTTSRPKAAPVLDAPMGQPLTGAISLRVGGNHACVGKAGNTVWCWGQNNLGQLGDTTPTNRLNPVMVTSAVVVATGTAYTCSLRADGTVWCSGARKRNRIGNGIGTDGPIPGGALTPEQVVTTRGGPPFKGATQIVASGVVCALVGKSVYCWGDNMHGQTGTGVGSMTPAPVLTTDGKPLTGVARIAAGGPHACAYLEDGELFCWGRGLEGAFGDGTFANRGLARPLGFTCQ